MLRKPETQQEGQAFVGTTFEKNFADSPGAAADWYRGSITGVTDKLRGTAQEGKKVFKGLFFHIRCRYQCTPLQFWSAQERCDSR